MEKPEVKWKQFLFIPGGSRAEAKSCSCQRLACSWAFVLLHFLLSHCILARTDTKMGDGSSWNSQRWPLGPSTTYGISWALVEPVAKGDTCSEANHVLVCATAGCCCCMSSSVELLAMWCTFALSISPSSFCSSVIIHQRFLKITVVPLLPAKSDYKPHSQLITDTNKQKYQLLCFLQQVHVQY